PGPQEVRAAGVGGGRPPQAAHRPAVSQAGRGPGGPPDRPGLQPPARGPRPLDAPTAGRPVGGVAHRRGHQRGPGAAAAKKNEAKPPLREQGGLPPKANADFVGALEQVLEVYARPYAPQRPVVGCDEASKQLLADVRPPLPPAPGQPQRVDYEY